MRRLTLISLLALGACEPVKLEKYPRAFACDHNGGDGGKQCEDGWSCGFDDRCFDDSLVDDGGHRMSQMIASFEAIYPTMPAPGVYLVEDTHTCFWGGEFDDRADGKTFLDYAADAYRGRLRAGSSRSLSSHLGMGYDDLDRALVAFLAGPDGPDVAGR